MAIDLTEGDARRLAVSVGSATRGTALTRILALRGSPGWIAGAAVREWHFEGITEQAGTVYLVGPHVRGTALKEIVTQDHASAIPRMGRIVRGLLRLSQSAAGWFPLQSDSLLLTDGGELLVLPPAVDRELRDLRPFEDNRETFECLNHPDLSGEARTVFAVAVALYRILTGRFPFRGEDPEELHSQARSLEIQPPAVVVPGLDSEASELVMSGLKRGRRPAVTLTQIAEALDAWQTRQILHPPSAEEKKTALAAAASREASATKSFRRRRFWQRNWRVAAVVAVAAIAAGALAGTVLKNVLAPRVTRGYAPDKVVQAFYTSMNTLGHATMQACVVGGAGGGEINEAMTLYVTSRVTMGYEGRSSIVSAADWDKAGRKPLVPPAVLYGVTGLSLMQEQGLPAPVYLVKYEKWNPAPRPDADLSSSAPPLSEGHAVTDRVWMKQDHGDWVIYRIDNVARVGLPAPVIGPPPPPPGQPGTPAAPGPPASPGPSPSSK
jgi:hypothetical protein